MPTHTRASCCAPGERCVADAHSSRPLCAWGEVRCRRTLEPPVPGLREDHEAHCGQRDTLCRPTYTGPPTNGTEDSGSQRCHGEDPPPPSTAQEDPTEEETNVFFRCLYPRRLPIPVGSSSLGVGAPRWCVRYVRPTGSTVGLPVGTGEGESPTQDRHSGLLLHSPLRPVWLGFTGPTEVVLCVRFLLRFVTPRDPTERTVDFEDTVLHTDLCRLQHLHLRSLLGAHPPPVPRPLPERSRVAPGGLTCGQSDYLRLKGGFGACTTATPIVPLFRLAFSVRRCSPDRRREEDLCRGTHDD